MTLLVLLGKTNQTNKFLFVQTLYYQTLLYFSTKNLNKLQIITEQDFQDLFNSFNQEQLCLLKIAKICVKHKYKKDPFLGSFENTLEFLSFIAKKDSSFAHLQDINLYNVAQYLFARGNFYRNKNELFLNKNYSDLVRNGVSFGDLYLKNLNKNTSVGIQNRLADFERIILTTQKLADQKMHKSLYGLKDRDTEGKKRANVLSPNFNWICDIKQIQFKNKAFGTLSQEELNYWLKLNAEFLPPKPLDLEAAAGLIEAEGSFMVQRKTEKNGSIVYKIEFSITIHYQNLVLLVQLQKLFNDVGYFMVNKPKEHDPGLEYVINNIMDLKNTLPIFKKIKFFGKKAQVFEQWERILLAKLQKTHWQTLMPLADAGIHQIQEAKKGAYPVPVNEIKPQQIVGFFYGDGSLSFTGVENKHFNQSISFIQHKNDLNLLLSIKNHFVKYTGFEKEALSIKKHGTVHYTLTHNKELSFFCEYQLKCKVPHLYYHKLEVLNLYLKVQNLPKNKQTGKIHPLQQEFRNQILNYNYNYQEKENYLPQMVMLVLIRKELGLVLPTKVEEVLKPYKLNGVLSWKIFVETKLNYFQKKYNQIIKKFNLQ